MPISFLNDSNLSDLTTSRPTGYKFPTGLSVASFSTSVEYLIVAGGGGAGYAGVESKMVKSEDHTVIAVPPTKTRIANPQLSKSTSVVLLVMLIATICKNFLVNSVPSQISWWRDATLLSSSNLHKTQMRPSLKLMEPHSTTTSSLLKRQVSHNFTLITW